jgi:hypothetical protein
MRAVVVGVCLVLTGCLHEQESEDYEPGPDWAQRSADYTSVREVDVTYDGPDDEDSAYSSALPPPSPADHPRPDPIPFRIGAGRGVLGQVDLRPCKEQGLAPGYLHVRVTFHNDGHIVHAAVESPAPPPEGALSCIGEQLEVAAVPAFDGRDVVLSKSYFVN